MRALADRGRESGVEYLGGTGRQMMTDEKGRSYEVRSPLRGGHLKLNEYWIVH